jgi:hypothetical protein
MTNPIRLSGDNMRIRLDRFNIIFLLATVALAGLAGCKSAESDKNKELSTLRVHTQAATEGATAVPVFRENPVLVRIEPAPLLTEGEVAKAAVVEVVGGFAIEVQFNRHGSWLLEQYTTANRDRHLAIFSEFGATTNETRWLAAPRITHRIADGKLVFTPDATREESERIVRGLTNAAKKLQKNAW